jgi:hypothetical protein
MHDAFCRPRDTKMTHQAILARSERNLSGVWDQDAMPKLTRGVEPKSDVERRTGMHTKHILFLSAIGAALLLGQGFVMNFV